MRLDERERAKIEERCRGCKHCAQGMGCCLTGVTSPICLLAPVRHVPKVSKVGKLYRSIYVLQICPKRRHRKNPALGKDALSDEAMKLLRTLSIHIREDGTNYCDALPGVDELVSKGYIEMMERLGNMCRVRVNVRFRSVEELCS